MYYDLYPVTLILDRYTGCYSGAPWIAFNLEPHELTNHPAEDSDIECSDFWASPESNQVGRGSTPNEAYANLVKRQEKHGTKSSSNSR